MSFRLEKKYILNPKKYSDFIRYLLSIKANKIHEKRIIFSTYFDNDFFTAYKHSEEGIVPRKKIRIRSYNNDLHLENSKLEVKISSEDNRFKKIDTINNKKNLENFLNNGLTDKNYGHCKAILNISYEREYYLLNDQRITLDKKIVYSSYKNNKKKFYEPLSIIEFKSDVNSEINSLNNIMTNSVSRFSKYCRGMNKVFFNIKDYT
tara:strand:- start:446 stop:1063 length:618 start_codon:yes stop_codon:yes gene_type:complete